VLTLGHSSVVSAGIAEFAYCPMKEIAEQFGIAVSLAAPTGADTVVVQRAEAPTILRLALHVGSALSMGSSALGWAYLAGIGPDERRRAFGTLRHSPGAAWPESERHIEAARHSFERQDYVLNLRHYHPDISDRRPGRCSQATHRPGAQQQRRGLRRDGGEAGRPDTDALKALAARLATMLPPV
jgi:DNA-binding IclR family transcriptional regulator